MRSPTMKSVMNHFNKEDRDKKRLMQVMKIASKRLSMAQIEVISLSFSFFAQDTDCMKLSS